jgi:thymidylate synthase ThyX
MITAKIIADSIAQNSKRLTTFELEFPKFLVAEFNTHRAISRNSASSRAIPFSKMVENIKANPAMPVFWGKNQAGMSAAEELDSLVERPRVQEVTVLGEKSYRNYLATDIQYARNLWREAMDRAIESAQKLHDLGCHKQIINRIIEPWMTTKVIATATDWDNFFFLRNHKDAQPEIAYLAKLMVEEYKNSRPKQLFSGEWHIPYIEFSRDYKGARYSANGEELSLEDALVLSTSLCAQVSYRKSDDSIEKAKSIFNKLINSRPMHSSPAEHQGTPHSDPNHVSGNFRGWIQHRHTLKDNTCNKYNFDNP